MSPIEHVIHDRLPDFHLRHVHHVRCRHVLAASVLVLASFTATGARAAAESPAGQQAVPELQAGAAGSGAVDIDAVGTDAAARGGAVTLDEVLGDSVDPLAQIEQQIQAEEYLPAMHDLQQRIDDIEAGSHRYDPRLIRPLTLLGDARAGMGEHDAALDHYQRALHLSRVNDGLNSPRQVEIVYREANAFKAIGDLKSANDREEYAYHVLNRAHDPMDEDLLPGIYHLAKWYERTSNVFAARALYEQAVAIIDSHDKLDTPEAIPALQGVATSYRMERFPPYYLSETEHTEASVVNTNTTRTPITVNNFPAGESALQRVIRIRQKSRDEDPVALAQSVLELADWYTLFDKPRRAEPLYAHAWELMQAVEAFDVVGYFAQPELLYFPVPGRPSPPPLDSRGERETGYVEVAFDVTEDGYVRSLSTVGSQPDGLMDFRVRKSLRLARYRPMLVDGVPVAKQAHTYRHEFPYYPELEREPQTAAANTES